MPTLLYVLATVVLLIASFWSGGVRVDEIFLSSGVIIGALVAMIYFMIERGVWIAGAGVFVDEKRGRRLDVLFMKYPLLFLYICALFFLAIGRAL